MPGMVGMIRIDGQHARISDAIAKLCHFSFYRGTEIQPCAGVSLGVVYRQSRLHEFDWHYDSNMRAGILISGTMITGDPSPHIMRAVDVLSEYQSQAFRNWSQFEGSFIVCIVDLLNDRMILANDRLGCLPLYYASTPNVFAFAPEVKGILVHNGFVARLSASGIVNFLSAGYCFGDLTLFEGVKILEPGSRLSISLSTLAVERTRLWKIVYEPAKELRFRRAAEDRLCQAIVTAHKTTLCDSPRRVAVMLSGGWDSRGILAALDRIHRPPELAQTWGLRDDIRDSDAFLARLLAEEFGIPFVSLSYNTDTFVENAEGWTYLSELANDNFGWFAEGAGVLSRFYDQSIDVILLGDEAWGWEGYAADETEARANVFPPTVPPAVRKILRASFANEANAMYDSTIAGVSRACENTDFIDRKDFLYLHVRVARFIFSLGYYKELATPVRRPFLSNGVLDVVKQLYPRHRMRKNLYISMLRHHFHRVMANPTSISSSLPDWKLSMRRNEGLRDYLFGLLNFSRINRELLGDLLDQRAFDKMRDEYFRAEVYSGSSQRSPWIRRHQLQLSRAVARSLWASKAVRYLKGPMSWGGPDSSDTLRRVALLSLLQDCLPSLSRRP